MFLFKKKGKKQQKGPKAFSSTAATVTATGNYSNAPLPETPILSGPMTGTQDVTPGGSKSYSFPRPPRLSPSSNLLGMSSPTSPVSALGFESPRQVPASFVRHLRVVSGASGSMAVQTETLILPLQSLQNRQRLINLDLPPELLPVVNLMCAQKLRQYASGSLAVLSDDRLTWASAEASLNGTELSIKTMGSTSPRYINIQDSSVVPTATPGPSPAGYDLMILQDFDGNLITLRFSDTEQLYTWLAAIHLAKFENSSLQEAYTAVILSLKGPELSDIFTLLAHKQRFSRFEWSNLRLPQISNKWIKVFVSITPGDAKKNGRLEVYASDKISKKNLVLYVDSLDSIYNVYPEDHHMIDINLIMKLEGRVYVNKNYQHLFIHGNDANPTSSPKGGDSSLVKSGSAMSLSSMGPPNAALGSPVRSRSNSLSSSSSFFFNLLPSPADVDLQTSTSPKAGNLFKKQTNTNFVETDYLYLMPAAHPGVTAIEIMLRNFIHIIDSFKLYGRPDHISSNKRDPVSMLFGLPALPHHGYMDVADALEVVALNFELSCLHNWGLGEWRTSLKEYLSCQQRDSNYKGTGNIYELFNSFEQPNTVSSTVNMSNFNEPSAADEFQQALAAKLRSPFMDSALRSLDSMPSTTSPHSNTISGLGNAFDYRKGAQDNFEGLLYHQRSLHPIADMPTPLDERAQPNFVTNEGGIAVHL